MKNEWICVTEDMPPCDQVVLTWDGYIIGLDYCDIEVDFGTTYFANLRHTTHWALIDTEDELEKLEIKQLEQSNDKS